MADAEKPEVWMHERCYITELINDEAWPEFSLARCRVERGVTTQLHTLGAHEFYIIEHGNGLMRIGDDPVYPVMAGDTVSIPEQLPQSITNTGEDDLVFLCVCAPRFLKERYTSLE